MEHINTHSELRDINLGILRLSKLTHHAKERAWERQIKIPRSIHACEGTVVEKHPDGRYLVRVPDFDKPSWDLCLSLKRIASGWLVITCYQNHKDDNHKTWRGLK